MIALNALCYCVEVAYTELIADGIQ